MPRLHGAGGSLDRVASSLTLSQTVRVAGRPITIHALPLVLIVLGLVYLVYPSKAPSYGYLPRQNTDDTLWGLHRTKSPFLVPPRDILPFHHKLPQIPDNFPEPVKPKTSGMRVPNSVHYVFGFKDVAEGQSPDELPYYAYLGMRSALLNLRPTKMYL